MTQQQALEWIHGIPRPGPKRDRSRMDAFLRFLGDPQEACVCVHVAGTNGKGSTASFLAAILSAAGEKTGLFTSPFIHDFRERIRIDGAEITPEELARETALLKERYLRHVAAGGTAPGEFEFVTALAFRYFAEKRCQAVVLEAGMGGLLDATNSITRPAVSVLCPVDLDHTQYLGRTLKEIARHKAGIIKPGCPAVSAPGQPPEVLEVFRERAESVGAALTLAPEPEAVETGFSGTDFTLEGTRYHVALPGAHQAVNAATALTAVRVLRERGFQIPEEAVRKGLGGVRAPGRLEQVGERPLRLVDGGHNPAAVRAACALLDRCGRGNLYTILGIMEDKDTAACIAPLARRSRKVFAVTSGVPRAMTPEAVAAQAAKDCADVTACGSLAQAAALARRAAGPEDTVLLCGSLYLIHEGEKLLQGDWN